MTFRRGGRQPTRRSSTGTERAVTAGSKPRPGMGKTERGVSSSPQDTAKSGLQNGLSAQGKLSQKCCSLSIAISALWNTHIGRQSAKAACLSLLFKYTENKLVFGIKH